MPCFSLRFSVLSVTDDEQEDGRRQGTIRRVDETTAEEGTFCQAKGEECKSSADCCERLTCEEMYDEGNYLCWFEKPEHPEDVTFFPPPETEWNSWEDR